MSKTRRIQWIDIAKCIGIILVLIGHISQNKNIHTFIYSFHMPLFFIISGYLYHDKDNYIKNKASKILIPYLFFSVVSFVYWYFIERNIRGQNINPINPLVNIIIARGGDENYIYNVALWFLPCLFTTEVIFHILIKKIKNIKILFVFILALSVVGYIYSLFDFIRLPFCIDIAFVAIGFYFIGYLWKDRGEKSFEKLNLSLAKHIILIIACFIVIIFSLLLPDMNMANLQYPLASPILYIIPTIGTFMIFEISKLINKCKWMEFLGGNSLVIMGIHEPIKRVVIEIMHRILNVSTEILRTNILGILATTIILLAICVPCIYILNRWFPVLLGKKYKISNIS